ncbi:MAG: two-component system sensor kinase [Conexibacter sp.]|nr:two-component system sensor kinase [Conexibacter sp.]
MRPTVRLRLAALYSVAFLIGGGLLLGFSYLVVRDSLLSNGPAARQAVIHRLGPAAAADRDDRARDRIIDQTRRELRIAALDRLQDAYFLALAVAAVLSATLGWLLAGRALRPLSEITATARRVSQENLHERIALTGPDDELKELADTFDTMLARLDAAFESQRSFIASASHELRTPLSIIRTEVDVTLQSRDVSREKLVAMAEVVRRASQRSERMIDALLTLARSDRGDLHRAPVNLAALARTALAELQAEAADRDLRVEADLAPAATVGDGALLERLVANLVQNAIRHNVPGGWLAVSTEAHDGRAVVVVANGGATIEPAELANLTMPFRRRGVQRTGGSVGSGLGLSIVDSVARAHDGELRLATPGEGLIATVELPGGAAAG